MLPAAWLRERPSQSCTIRGQGGSEAGQSQAGVVSARPIRAGVSPLHRVRMAGPSRPEEARWDDSSSAAPHQGAERFRDCDR